MANPLSEQIADGRTDLVCDDRAAELIATEGVTLIKWCAYYGDVSALRFLLSKGIPLSALGPNFDLNGAVFHGHWQLCQFLLECGADANAALPDTGETPLHSALCKLNHPAQTRILRVLLAAGANSNTPCNAAAPTGGFMRDCRTKAETPLHRAAAFGSAECVQLLIDAGAKVEARDMHGDSPLAWASWHLRPVAILRKLLYGEFRIHPEYASMEENLLGRPHTDECS